MTVNLDAVAENYRALKAKSGKPTAAVIKADAYGLGMVAIARRLEREGCHDFFVVTIDEGVRLRANTDRTIFLLGGIHSGDRSLIEKHDLIPVLNSLEDITAWKGRCAIHFDTGMNRTGLSEDEAEALIADPSRLSHLKVELALSHFACADEPGHPLTQTQCEKFARIHSRLAAHLPGTRWSLANSSGIFERAGATYDLVRPGYALYGGNPTPHLPNPMRPVIRLEATIVQIRQVAHGESVGYGASHVFDTDTQIATLCLGYADGYMRGFSGPNHGRVYWKNLSCPILGRVSMDLISVGIGHLPDKPKAGDRMEIIGAHQDIDEVARQAGTIGYEILTSLGNRYARIYKGAS